MDNQNVKELSLWNQQMSTLRKVKSTKSQFYFMRSQMIGFNK
jgi:hypothetical protein